MSITIDPEFRDQISLLPADDFALFEEKVRNSELRRRFPKLSEEQKTAFLQNRLGFRGENQRGTRVCTLYPTPMSPHFWLWSLVDIDTGIEEYTPRETATCRLPWKTIGDIPSFSAFVTEPSRTLIRHSKANIRKQASHLYAIQSILGGPIKIGKSSDPWDRAKQLQPGNPFLLCVIRIFENKGHLESKIHKYLQEYSLQGEWFREEALLETDRYFCGEKQDD